MQTTYLYEKGMDTEVAADALMKSGTYGPVQQTRFPHELGCLDHNYVCSSLSRGIPLIDPGELEKGSTNLFMLYYYKHQSDCSQLGYCLKKKKISIPELMDTDTLLFVTAAPKELAEFANFQKFSKENDAHWCVIRKPLHKEGKKPRAKLFKIQCFVTPLVLQQKHQ